MTPTEINRLIATEVMGWKLITLKPTSLTMPLKVEYWAMLPRYTESPNDPSLKMKVEDFDPYHNSEHALMAVDALVSPSRSVEITLSHEGVCCDICDDTVTVVARASAKTISAAICEAIVEVVGGKE